MPDEQRFAIYPGTFDPITLGHLDIIQRATPLFDKVFVTLALNSDKSPLFSTDERLQMIRESVKGIDCVEVTHFDGLIVQYAQDVGAKAIVRGLRAVSDFEYEFQIALMNRKLWQGIDTVFLMPDVKYTYLSSSIVREIARHGGNVDCFVAPDVAAKLKEKFQLPKGIEG
ncbi:MAG: pantetheine-phosphate adenylyltransferase [Calditrichaeota bacterium]|jgi:pantetheine-phosphate adenylyltransferase|nr:pantetheine-phosphate adenylyltransferase [Calditrichota bacterium]MBT7615785.1 pantetheine-phosphate adenylyltransferase [Calditrichota bacterium]MBT7788533.1 pantetheine-phosphate adenylyltransferase [Calditrichota bacterium]